jgi:hypothetical protein
MVLHPIPRYNLPMSRTLEEVLQLALELPAEAGRPSSPIR